MANLIMACAEIMTQVSLYDTFDENRFSKALDTQLRRNLMVRFAYLRLRIHAWYSSSSRQEGEQCGVILDSNP